MFDQVNQVISRYLCPTTIKEQASPLAVSLRNPNHLEEGINPLFFYQKIIYLYSRKDRNRGIHWSSARTEDGEPVLIRDAREQHSPALEDMGQFN